MDISVIMSTYKEPEELLRQAIDSILTQTYSNFEFIIILDHPENKDHKRIIEEYGAKDSRIKFFVNDDNIGLAGSLNRAIQYSSGKYICRMDADDISLPKRLERQKKYLENGDFDLIGGITQVIDDNGEILYSIRHVPDKQEEILKALCYNQVLAHPTWFGRRNVFEDLKGYREIPLCEDSDLTLRAALKGYRLSNLNETVLKYRMSSKSVSRNNLFEQYLYLRYITAEYRKGRVADIAKAKTYVASKNKESTAVRYAKANVRFNKLLNDLEEKKFMAFLVDGMKLVFASRYYLDKIYRLARVSMCKK